MHVPAYQSCIRSAYHPFDVQCICAICAYAYTELTLSCGLCKSKDASYKEADCNCHSLLSCLLSRLQRVHPLVAGDTGLEIAPGKDVDENPDLKEIGNIWNTVPTAKHWTPIDPIEGCITVNIGDGLQWWTDGLFKSTYHRVRAPKDGDNKVDNLNSQVHMRTRYKRRLWVFTSMYAQISVTLSMCASCITS